MADIPPPPPGFVPVAPTAAVTMPPPPPGFVPVTAAPPAAAPATEAAGPPVPPPAPPKEPSLVDRIMGVGDTAGGLASQALVGVRKGVSGVLGLPVDAVAGAYNVGAAGANRVLGTEGGYISKPVGGSETIDNIFAAPARVAQSVIGQPQADPAPRNVGERMVRRVGEEVGGMAVPVGAAVGKAAQVGIEGARKLTPMARMMVEPAAVNRGKFIGRETEAAVAAGTGAGAVNEMTGKSTTEHPSVGQTLGDVGGAVGGLGLYTAGKTLLNAAGHVITALRGKSTDAANETIRAVSTDEIARAAGLAPNKAGVIDTDPLAKAINEGTRVSDTIPGFQESTADRTKNAGLAAMEYSRQSGPGSGSYAARRTANTDAVDAAMKKSEPGGTPGALSSDLVAERDRQLMNAAIMRGQAEDTATAAVAPLTPQGTPAGRGNTIRTEAETARQTARDATEAAYEQAGIHDNPLHPTTLAEALDTTTANLPYADRVGTPQGLIDQIAQIPAGEPTTVRQASALKTQLLAQREAAAAEPGGRNRVRVLDQYIDAVEGVIQGAITPEQRAALGTARETRRAEGDAFERRGDPVAEMLARNPGGTPRMLDENVARLATRDDAMGRLLEEADTPATRAAIRNELLSNADTASAAGLHGFQQQYGQQIARFPGLNDELGAAIRARVSENTARGAEGGLQKEIGREGRGTVARYLQYGDENAQRAMTGVMKSKDPAKAADELLSFVGDSPQAVEGARKVFWDILQKETRSAGSTTKTMNGTQPYLPAALKKFMEDPATAAVAQRLYRDNPEHLDNLTKIKDAMQGVDVRNSAKAPNTSGTAQGLQGGILPSGETIASRVFAVERGVVSPTFAAINIAGIIARKAMKQANIAAVDKTIDKALLDPDFAAVLLKENNPANRAALRRYTKGWQAHEASTVMQMLQPDDKDAETKKAVMK